MRGIAAAIVSLVLTLTATTAQAATFVYTMRAPVVQFGSPGDVYIASGRIFADDDGSGGFDITGADGTFSIEGYPEFSRTVGGAEGRLVADGLGGFYASEFALFEEDGGFLAAAMSRNAMTGTYELMLGEVGAPKATLTFAPTVSGAVPEPATWGMMILGFGAIGFAMRRRRSTMRTTVVFA